MGERWTAGGAKICLVAKMGERDEGNVNLAWGVWGGGRGVLWEGNGARGREEGVWERGWEKRRKAAFGL